MTGTRAVDPDGPGGVAYAFFDGIFGIMLWVGAWELLEIYLPAREMGNRREVILWTMLASGILWIVLSNALV